MNKNIKNKNKSVKSKKIARRSMKGKMGTQVGAPAKPFRIPNGQFTMESAFGANKNQCHLSVRKKIDAGLADKSIIQLAPRKQPKGGVGRPKAVFVKAENFDDTKHIRLGATAPVANTTAIPLTQTAPEVAPEPVIVAEIPTPAPATVVELPQPAEVLAETRELAVA